jgi:pimeloyl-ACP methyl ester carboxylesterase
MEQNQTTKHCGRIARTMRTSGIVLLSVLFVLYVLLPVGMGVFAAIRPARVIEPPPEGYQTVSLTAQDGTALACWYAAGTNGAAIILVHGSKSNLASVETHAAMLRDAGYGVLALTLRGHGGSGGSGNAFGWQCGADVSAAVDYLRSLGVEKIGALGLSMGGEVLLSSAAEEPEITAIVADGATQHSLKDYFLLEENRTLLHSWTTQVLYATVSLLTGQQPPERSIVDSITEAKNASFLLVSAEQVKKEKVYGEAFVAVAPDRVSLWVAPGAGHTGGIFNAREAYQERVIAFFDGALRPSN